MRWRSSSSPTQTVLPPSAFSSILYCTGMKVLARDDAGCSIPRRRHPGADEPDQGRLDDVLTVDEVIVVGLIDTFENPAADLRQDADPDVLVFQIDNGVSLVDFLSVRVSYMG